MTAFPKSKMTTLTMTTLTHRFDTYSYKTGYINGILVGGSRRFLLYFDNLSDDEIDDFEIVCR
jgi:hypothetical protein